MVTVLVKFGIRVMITIMMFIMMMLLGPQAEGSESNLKLGQQVLV